MTALRILSTLGADPAGPRSPSSRRARSGAQWLRRVLVSSLLVGGAVALSGCGGRHHGVTAQAAPASGDWRSIATAADRTRLRGWRTAWLEALAKTQAAGNAAQIAEQGALFDPDHALDHAMPPPGDYRCRVFKLGAKGTAMADFTAYPFFACSITAAPAGSLETARFSKVGGSQRPSGPIYADSDARAVFLGTMVLGDERRPLPYGTDQARDMAGYVERIGDRRWRLVMPYPQHESVVDVMELLPADQ